MVLECILQGRSFFAMTFLFLSRGLYILRDHFIFSAHAAYNMSNCSTKNSILIFQFAQRKRCRNVVKNKNKKQERKEGNNYHHDKIEPSTGN